MNNNKNKNTVMTHKIYKSLSALMLCCMAMIIAACDDGLDGTALSMGGDCFITRLVIDGQEGDIDNTDKTVTVYLAPGTDLTSLRPELTLSPGAVSDIASGSVVDFTMPVVFKITNGNAYIDYTVTARCYDAAFTSFTLTDAAGTRYQGTVDNDAHTIVVYLPYGTDVSRLIPSYTLTDGATASPSEGSAFDFSSPVTFTVSNHGLDVAYTVTVVASDMPVTAFIGTAATVSGLKDEERAAAEWMLANVARSRYISMQDIISGAVKLDPSEIKVLWWHCDDDTWPSQGWDSRDMIKDYYARGGSLMLTRYACKYINDVYQIAIDQREPNAQNKSDVALPLDVPLGFVVDVADHPIFDGMNAVEGQPVYLVDAGFATKNTQVDWNIWDYPDHSLTGWEQTTGGRRLAYEGDDSNKTAIVEFPARTASAGRVVLVGTGGYEWNIANGSANPYASNRTMLTVNILKYLAAHSVTPSLP